MENRDKAEQQGIKVTGFIMERKLPIRQTQDNPIYGGLVETMDDAVGVVLNALKAQGLDKNTIVIFTSDNGGVSSGDSFSTSNLPYKGGKGYQWEGGIREPYVIYEPWEHSNGKTFEYPVIKKSETANKTIDINSAQNRSFSFLKKKTTPIDATKNAM